MGDTDPDEFIQYSLQDLKELPSIFAALKSAWLTGDMKKMAEVGIEPMLKDFPDTYKSLIFNRNKAWIPKIETMLKTKGIEMVLVGALHLAGPDSVLKQLEMLGYEINQY